MNGTEGGGNWGEEQKDLTQQLVERSRMDKGSQLVCPWLRGFGQVTSPHLASVSASAQAPVSLTLKLLRVK